MILILWNSNPSILFSRRCLIIDKNDDYYYMYNIRWWSLKWCQRNVNVKEAAALKFILGLEVKTP